MMTVPAINERPGEGEHSQPPIKRARVDPINLDLTESSDPPATGAIRDIPSSSSLPRFQPKWSVKNTDSYVDNSIVAREVISHLSSLEKDAKIKRLPTSDLISMSYRYEAKSSSISHLLATRLEAAEKELTLEREKLKKVSSEATDIKNQFETVSKAFEKKVTDYNTLSRHLAKVDKENAALKEQISSAIDDYRSSDQYNLDARPYHDYYIHFGYKKAIKDACSRAPEVASKLATLHPTCSHPAEPPAGEKCYSDKPIREPWAEEEEGEGAGEEGEVDPEVSILPAITEGGSNFGGRVEEEILSGRLQVSSQDIIPPASGDAAAAKDGAPKVGGKKT